MLSTRSQEWSQSEGTPPDRVVPTSSLCDVDQVIADTKAQEESLEPFNQNDGRTVALASDTSPPELSTDYHRQNPPRRRKMTKKSTSILERWMGRFYPERAKVYYNLRLGAQDLEEQAVATRNMKQEHNARTPIGKYGTITTTGSPESGWQSNATLRHTRRAYAVGMRDQLTREIQDLERILDRLEEDKVMMIGAYTFRRLRKLRIYKQKIHQSLRWLTRDEVEVENSS